MKKRRMEMIYLACPYSHDNMGIREWRYKRVTEAAAILVFTRKIPVYSPITQTHPMDVHRILHMPDVKLGDEHDFWLNMFDFPFLRTCSNLAVLMLPGWEESKGVSMELKEAKWLGLEIEYLEPLYTEFGLVRGFA